MMKIYFRTMFLTAAAAFLHASAVGGAETKPAQTPAKTPPVKVLCEKVITEPNMSVRRYVGHVKAFSSVKLPARVSGILLKKHFVEGDIVKAGQLLFEIEDTSYRAKAQQAAAQVKEAQAKLDYAKIDYERQKGLRATQAVSEAVYEEALRVLRTSEASLASARAVQLEADNNLSYTKVYAPITGLIGKSTYSEGNYVTPSSSSLAEVVQTTPIYVCFALSERDYQEMFGDYKNMQKNGVARYQLADGKLYSDTGKIHLMDNIVDETTGTITAWSLVDNPDFRLIPGGFATVMLSNKSAPVMTTVRLSSVMADAQGNYVYVIGADKKIQIRYIKLANVIGERQFVESGLLSGETVVTDGTNRVRPGDNAEPVLREAAPAK